MATLGGSVYGNPKGNNEEEGITLPAKNDSDDSGISLSSDESDLWNATTNDPDVIGNINGISTVSDPQSTSNEIAILMACIAVLQGNQKDGTGDMDISPPEPNDNITTQNNKDPTGDINTPRNTDSHPQHQQVSNTAEDGKNN